MASQIKKIYPKAWAADCEAAKAGRNTLGNYSVAKVKDNKYVINIYSSSTNDTLGRFTDYDALKKGLTKAKWYLETFLNSPTIGMGHIGCGPGRGDCNIVRKILSEVFDDYEGDIKIIDTQGS